jgi:2-keto-4-pentenoate hydratase
MVDIGSWAASLLSVHAGGAPIDALPGLADEGDGYAVQAAVARGLGPTVGYKLSFTTADPPPNGLGRAPAYGPFVADQVHSDGASIPLVGEPLVECELVMRAREELAPGLDPGALAARVDVAPAIEVPVSRFRSWWPAGGSPRLDRPEFIADACLAAHLVVGAPWRPASGLALAEVEVVLDGPGGELARGRGAAVMGDPLRALAWLVESLGGLPAGLLVATGTLTAPVRPVAGVHTATFTGLGAVDVSFVEGRGPAGQTVA